MTTGDDLCFQSARELLRRIRAKDVSAGEVMAAHLARIERLNPCLNAIVTLHADEAVASARRADEALATASSACSVTIAFRHGFRRSIRARCAAITSPADTSLARMRRNSSRADWKQRSSPVVIVRSWTFVCRIGSSWATHLVHTS